MCDLLEHVKELGIPLPPPLEFPVSHVEAAIHVAQLDFFIAAGSFLVGFKDKETQKMGQGVKHHSK